MDIPCGVPPLSASLRGTRHQSMSPSVNDTCFHKPMGAHGKGEAAKPSSPKEAAPRRTGYEGDRLHTILIYLLLHAAIPRGLGSTFPSKKIFYVSFHLKHRQAFPFFFFLGINPLLFLSSSRKIIDLPSSSYSSSRLVVEAPCRTKLSPFPINPLLFLSSSRKLKTSPLPPILLLLQG